MNKLDIINMISKYIEVTKVAVERSLITFQHTIKESLKQNGEIMNTSISSEKNISPELREEIIAEYTTLRGEILRRIGMRQQILAFSLIILGTILTLTFQKDAPYSIPLIYPILNAFLAIGWAHNDRRIGELADYIRYNIELNLIGINWENYIKQIKYSKRFAIPLREFYAIGIFVGAAILTVLIPFPNIIKLLQSEEKIRSLIQKKEIILLIFDIVAIIFTCLIVPLRRRRKIKAPFLPLKYPK